jgi:hypothetical protein
MCHNNVKTSYVLSFVRFQVLEATGLKMAVLWVAAQCTLVEACRRFRSASFIIRVSHS